MTKPTTSYSFRVTETDIQRLLTQGRHAYWSRLNAGLIRRMMAEIAEWPTPVALEPQPLGSPEGQKAQWLAEFLRHGVLVASNRLTELPRRHTEFVRTYDAMVTESDKRGQILAYARELGSSPHQLAGDRRAFERWFGYDAVTDRYQHRFRQTERDLCVHLDCLGHLCAFALHENRAVLGHGRLWQRLNLEMALTPLFTHSGDARVPSAALNCLSMALQAVPAAQRLACLDEATLLFAQRTATTAGRNVWVQVAALTVLHRSAPEVFVQVARQRLQQPQDGDDLFLRRRTVLMVAEGLADTPGWMALLPLALADPSPYVRQALCEALTLAPAADAARWLPDLLLRDREPTVRAAAAWSLARHCGEEERRSWVLDCLQQVLDREQDTLVLRTAMATVKAVHLEPDWAGRWQDQLASVLARLHREAPSLAVRRWAQQTAERLWCEADPEARRLREQWQTFLATVPLGSTRRLPRPLAGADEATLGRVLAVLAQEDFGCDVEYRRGGGYVTRGPVFGWRLWRMLHELANPSPDKRQAFQHTIGRLFFGNLRVPPQYLAELAETKVPGEPLYMAAEDGWRPYLPLLDEVIACLRQNQTTRIYTAEGVTELAPPRNPLRRLAAHWRLSRQFANFAHLRNFSEGLDGAPDAYLQALARVGVTARFRGYGTSGLQDEDPAVRRFFPAALTLPAFSPERWWSGLRDYFVSVYENTLFDLALYLGAAIAAFLGRHVYQYIRLRRARRRLPLVVGGWGTRGKSGTERLKAALASAMGCAVVSKSTGCEAMFLHGYPFGTLKELFLFRPYDKATIWEQRNLVLFADTVGCEIFLWECMALTPSYVRVLQRQWMRDDISTLTNAYPDHEDIQGPAGINIPQVMTQFIPERAVLLTSEEQMLPIFREEARRVGTRIQSVGWLEAGLLTPDVMARFPYDEHPYNVALVLALALELQVPEDVALKEMADRVVPDLGVLKAFPTAVWRSRRLEFINGMSANERFGCLGNWQRMGLDRANHETDPATWITMVVNNRADRVARSQVFASVVVKDLACDRIVLIGNNLHGLLGYIRTAWAEWVAEVNLVAVRN